MGLYDEIICEYPLPIEGANGLTYQTKDTPSQFCERYKISEDGYLWFEDHDIVDRSDPKAQGIARLFGRMVRINKRWVKEDYTGEIRFYTFWRKEPFSRKGWIEFSSCFEQGKLVRLNTIEFRKE